MDNYSGQTHDLVRSIRTSFGTIEIKSERQNSQGKGSSDGKLRTELVTGSCSRSTAYRFARTIARVRTRPSEIYPNLFQNDRDTQ
jgi:hypothetical protein